MTSYTTQQWKRWEQRQALGIDTSLLPAAPLQKILNTWYSWGFSATAIASAAPISRMTFDDIINGRTTMVRQETYREISRMDYRTIFDTAEDGGQVANFAAKRRVGALNRIGWSMKDLGEISKSLGGSPGTPTKISSSHRLSVPARHHRLIAQIYDQISGTPGGSHLSRMTALNNGVPSPMAWDDIDNYYERPKVSAW